MADFFHNVGEYYIMHGAVHPEDKGKVAGGWAYATGKLLAEWLASW